MTYSALRHLKVGECAQFKEVQGSTEILQQLIGLGFFPGASLTVLQKLGDQHVVSVGRSKVAIGNTLSHKIIVGRQV